MPRLLILITFLLTRLMRGAATRGAGRKQTAGFLLTRLMRGAAITATIQRSDEVFLLTRLMRGAAAVNGYQRQLTNNFYSRASCEARLGVLSLSGGFFRISTHAPHARRG